MKKFLLVAAALLLVADQASAGVREWNANDKGRISLGCKPIPTANAQPDSNPTVRVNIDLEFTDQQGNARQVPVFSVLHFLANGRRADRWEQYNYQDFQFVPEGKDNEGNDRPANFIFVGSLKGHPQQVIGMQLWTPQRGSTTNDWFYQEYIGTTQRHHLTMTARCTEEPLHD